MKTFADNSCHIPEHSLTMFTEDEIRDEIKVIDLMKELTQGCLKDLVVIEEVSRVAVAYLFLRLIQ